jgi:hypothetical protein
MFHLKYFDFFLRNLTGYTTKFNVIGWELGLVRNPTFVKMCMCPEGFYLFTYLSGATTSLQLGPVSLLFQDRVDQGLVDDEFGWT